ncbi:MAG: NAD-dependent epimerase/dehydratase family protein [Gaiellaceae bacterium]
MRYTVLGATGYIGSHLVAMLERAGAEVLAPSRGSSGWEADCGRIVYCIGLTGDFRSRPLDTIRAHVSYLADVLERARYESFTYLSSTRVYVDVERAAEDESLHVAPERSDDLYNLSKLVGEALCLRCAGENARVVSLSNVYGDPAPPHTFLSEILESASERQEVVLRDHLDSEKDYVHVDDVVQLLRQISDSGRERIYNVASGANVSNRALLDVVRRETGCRIESNASAPVRRFPPIDTSRISSEFGFRPRSLLAERPSLIRRDDAG